MSGARDWTDAQREAYANDLTRPQLLAVSASSNRSKGESPSDRQPGAGSDIVLVCAKQEIATPRSGCPRMQLTTAYTCERGSP